MKSLGLLNQLDPIFYCRNVLKDIRYLDKGREFDTPLETSLGLVETQSEGSTEQDKLHFQWQTPNGPISNGKK